ncbi:hypothetical protein [Streptomyces sp. BA2]|uniref:hypothetical protein n=1 Tax=Streptomyces sp. BA2 TaxID=436595 RepID=UPI001370B1BA
MALDGRAGAGKTTLAADIAAHLGGPRGAAIVHGDDFLRPMSWQARLTLGAQEGYQSLFDVDRLQRQVLSPLRGGRPARYRRYDPDTNSTPEHSTVEIEPGRLVIVEGVFVARPELAALYELTVFLDTPPDLCRTRLHARGQSPERLAWLACWQAIEEHYVTTTLPHNRVDLVLR